MHKQAENIEKLLKFVSSQVRQKVRTDYAYLRTVSILFVLFPDVLID